ncbi:MAG: fused MFS/spermidine synthase [Bryobacteraceae bacterium]
MLLYALTILVSAFLLFQVQPVIARIILPWFGGSAAVWTTCLLFFQSVLLLGYLYAHWLHRKLRPRAQMFTHIVLLAASLAILPIWPAASWKPTGGDDPTWRILGLLTITVGLPYFLLSTTGPLLQAWYADRYRDGMPYRLYALSNAGSMFALISYPVLFEPWLGTHLQALTWSIAYGGFILLCAATAWLGQKYAVAPLTEPPPDTPDAPRKIFFWIALPACASTLLLAITNHLTQNVAAIPFLWILPLSLYLLSFILCFESEGWYRRRAFRGLFAVAVGGMTYALSPEFQNNAIKIMIPFFAVGLFICCMVCHGELARLKPHPSRLTYFYAMVALGGALGGVFVALIAPRVFPGVFELPIGLVACAVVVVAVWRADPESGLAGSWLQPAPLAAALMILAVAAYVGFVIHLNTSESRLMVRNFYGGLRIVDQEAEHSEEPVRRLLHGTITHGEQFLNPRLQSLPTTYYGRNSGVGRAIRQFQEGGPVRVGVIGLGAGTLAAYGRAGDYFRFYEINPLVLRLAHSEFTYLSICKARLNVTMGDARLSLEREAPQDFDVLAVDAFSSDAIPVHLLTREAFLLYFRHLRADGVLAVHVSNSHLDLRPVVALAAAALGKTARVVDTGDEDNDVFGSTWVLVASCKSIFEKPLLRTAVAAPASRQIRMWTDDYSNLFRILK